MSTITIPANLAPAFVGGKPSRICDENGNILGYYTPRREATEEDYEWAMKAFTVEEIEASKKSGIGRPFAEVIAELKRREQQ